MAAMRGQQVQDQCRCEVEWHRVLRQADREAGAKMHGVAAALASPKPAY
jgi:hypothetical protein